MRYFKIALSVFFVLAVAFFVVKGCVREKPVKVKARPPARVVRHQAPPRKTVPAKKEARMAIVLDDWGNKLSLADTAVGLKRPLTLAILPHLRHSRRIAEKAHQNNLGVMLHMPMQPKGDETHLEPHTLTTDMSEADIIKYLDSALADVPYVQGVNNHMGSAATSDRRVISTVLAHLKKKGLFFMDSSTTTDTLGPTVAKELGLPFTKRDVFLDNELKAAAIRVQLGQARDIALKYGQVVAIGHDYKVTLDTIKEVIPEFEKQGIRFVLVKELVE